MKKTVIYSYLRHLVITAYGIALTYTSLKHQSIYKVTGAELKYVAIALWTSVLPQLRHTAPIAVNLYIKKKYPALASALKDLTAPTTPTV